MGTINRAWQEAHRMPPKATDEQRGQWHAEHQDACGCRTPSDKESALIAAWRATHPAG